MSLEVGVFSLLSGGSTNAGTRIYPRRIPENPTYPLIVYMILFERAPLTRDDSDNLAAGLRRYTVQLDIWGLTYEQARTTTDQVNAIIKGGTYGGAVFDYAFSEERPTGYDEDADLFRRTLDVVIWYRY